MDPEPEQTLLKNALKTVIGQPNFKGDGFKYNDAFISHAQAGKEHADKMAALDKEHAAKMAALNEKERELNERETALNLRDQNNTTGLEEATKRFNEKIEQITVEYEVKLALANYSKNACEDQLASANSRINACEKELNSLREKTADFQKNLLAENIKALIAADEIKKNAINANNDDLQDKLMSANVELLTYKNMLKKALDDVAQHNSTNNQTNLQLNKQIQQLNQTIIDLNTKLESTNAELLTYKNMLSKASTDVEQNNAENQKLRQDLHLINREFTVKTLLHKTAFKNYIADMKKGHLEEIIKLKIQITDLDNRPPPPPAPAPAPAPAPQYLDNFKPKYVEQFLRAEALRQKMLEILQNSFAKTILFEVEKTALKNFMADNPDNKVKNEIANKLNSLLAQKMLNIYNEAKASDKKTSDDLILQKDLEKQLLSDKHNEKYNELLLQSALEKHLLDEKYNELKEEMDKIKHVYPNTSITLLP